MAQFRIRSPDGKEFIVNAPEGATQDQVLEFAKTQWDKTPQAGAQQFDPTEGMSETQKFLAGVGKAFTDVGRGAGQAVGLVSREDVEEARRRDAPLMRTGAGQVGNIVGNIAATAPTALIPGAATLRGAAAIGAGTGFLAPSVSTSETLGNIAMGGAAAPAAMLAGRALGSAYQGGKALIEPLTRGGQERIAARTLQQFATNPAVAAANLRKAAPLVPGSAPTMAQAADDAGIAQLERTLMNNPETGGRLAEQYAAQRAARLGAIRDIAGSDEYLNLIKEGRKTFAAEDYAKAMSQGIDPDMAKSLKPQIKSLLGRPSIKEAQQRAVALARENDIKLNDFSSLQGLDWLKKGLDDVISSAASPTSSVGKEKLRALMQTKDDLMMVLDDLAPGYRQANENFAGMSRNINSMEVARDLQKRLEPALARYGANTRETGAAYAQALEAAGESVKKSTGMNKPLKDVMNAKDYETLQNIARDFARQAKAQDMGRATGSNTAQNLAAQNLLRRTLGPAGLPQSWAESNVLQGVLSPYTGLVKLAGGEQRVMDRLLQAAMDPGDAAGLLRMAAQPVSGLGLLGQQYQRALPALTSGGLLSYGAQ